MPRPPAISGLEAVRVFEKAGWTVACKVERLIRYGGSRNESALRKAFLDLLEQYASSKNLLLVPEVEYRRRGIIEAWGRGTLKMAELTEQAGLPRPEFEETAGVLVVRFRPSRYLPPTRVGHDLTEQQQAILQLLSERAGLALSEIHQQVGRGALRSVREDLAFLKQLGTLDSIGHARGARWYLAGQNRTANSG